MEFFKKKAVRNNLILASLALVLSFLLVPERVAVSTSAIYPHVRADLKLNPNVIAMVPIPMRKPEADPIEKSRYSVFKGLRNLIGFDDEAEEVAVVTPEKKRSSVMSGRFSSLAKSVRAKLKEGQPVAALQYFRNASLRKSMSVSEHDEVQSQIAAGFLYSGKIQSAGKLAAQSAERSGRNVPMAGWVAGLSLWQQEQYAQSAKYFEVAAASPEATTWMASAASFWASRAHERAGNNRGMMIALQKAAQYPRTFYGLMAVQALGQKFDFNWSAPEFDGEREAVLKTSSAGVRAMDLVAQKRFEVAETELLRISDTQDPDLRDALLAYANHVGLPKLAMRLGNSMLKQDGQYYDAALYPVTPWEPEEGFSVDPALVHAVMRQESKFDSSARSTQGAMGLMQIMPTTARYVARNNAYSVSDLQSPKANLKVGQDYLKYLLKDKNVDGDIMMLLVAYNAGPGNLAKWKAALNGSEDPLLFIEMIPVKETREYVEHVMVNYWMYRLRDGKDVPTLRAVSRGEPAKYAQTALDEGAYRLAMLAR